VARLAALVWVTRLSDGKPVPDADVAVAAQQVSVQLGVMQPSTGTRSLGAEVCAVGRGGERAAVICTRRHDQ
jgi:hypothetical protein